MSDLHSFVGSGFTEEQAHTVLGLLRLVAERVERDTLERAAQYMEGCKLKSRDFYARGLRGLPLEFTE